MKKYLCNEQKLLHWKREAENLSTVLIPWELRIKEIESHFGSVVASYFTFLRWLLWVNIVIAVVLTIFVVMPEVSNELDLIDFKVYERANSSNHLASGVRMEQNLRSPQIYASRRGA